MQMRFFVCDRDLYKWINISDFSKNILCFITDAEVRVLAMKACSGVELRRLLFLISALDRGEWSALCSGCCVLQSKNTQSSFNNSGGPQNHTHTQKLNHVRGFWHPPRCEWDLLSSGMLGSLDWCLVTEVSAQRIGYGLLDSSRWVPEFVPKKRR
jgi:hypothetical protein